VGGFPDLLIELAPNGAWLFMHKDGTPS